MIELELSLTIATVLFFPGLVSPEYIRNEQWLFMQAPLVFFFLRLYPIKIIHLNTNSQKGCMYVHYEIKK